MALGVACFLWYGERRRLVDVPRLLDERRLQRYGVLLRV
jgi:hypothetical protein